MYLVASIFNITQCKRSTGALAYVLFVIKKCLILKSFSKEVKSCLNSDPLSNTTWRGRGYLHRHVLLNNCLTLADDLFMYSSLLVVSKSRSYVGISTIPNQPLAGLIMVLQVRPTLYLMIVPPIYCCLIDLLYDLSDPHAPNLTVLVVLLSYVEDVHRESFSF